MQEAVIAAPIVTFRRHPRSALQARSL